MGTFADARARALLYWLGVAEQAPANCQHRPHQSEKASDPMQCPSCGLDLGNTFAANCPRCGQPVTQSPPAGAYGAFGSAPTPPPTPVPTVEQPGMPYGATAPQWPAQPGYGQPTAGYGAPPAYSPAAQSPYGYPGGMPPAPPAPKRNNNALIIGAVIAVLVLGGVAVFALSGGKKGTVSTTPTATATRTQATATATATTSQTGASVVYQNALTNSPSGWTTDSHCSFSSDGYHIQGGYICYAPTDQQSDVGVDVQVSQLSGDSSSGFGVVFRRASQGNYYSFRIDSGGEWAAFVCQSGSCNKLGGASDSAIQTGLNATNELEVDAAGSHFDFYVNGTKVGSADDSTFSSGEIGLSGADGDEVVFSNLTIGKLA